MTEEDARLALLQTELSSLQEVIRSLNTTETQIKGWCVTASLAIGGFAVAYHKPALLLVGVGAVLGFWLINSQVKMWQRLYAIRNHSIGCELGATGVMEVLRGK